MGFGLLFIGYIFAFGLTAGTNYILALLGVIGAAILYFASKKLAIYTDNFKKAKYSAVALAVAFILNAAVQIIQKYAAPDLNINFIGAVSGALAAVIFLYNFFMYIGIADIARTADNAKIVSNAVFATVLMITYYASLILSKLIYPYFQKISAIFSFCAMILGFVWLTASVILLFSCYMRICREGEENMIDESKKGN